MLIEHAVKTNDGRPAVLVAHSMGCLVSLYFITRQSADWRHASTLGLTPILCITLPHPNFQYNLYHIMTVDLTAKPCRRHKRSIWCAMPVHCCVVADCCNTSVMRCTSREIVCVLLFQLVTYLTLYVCYMLQVYILEGLGGHFCPLGRQYYCTQR